MNCWFSFLDIFYLKRRRRRRRRRRPFPSFPAPKVVIITTYLCAPSLRMELRFAVVVFFAFCVHTSLQGKKTPVIKSKIKKRPWQSCYMKGKKRNPREKDTQVSLFISSSSTQLLPVEGKIRYEKERKKRFLNSALMRTGAPGCPGLEEEEKNRPPMTKTRSCSSAPTVCVVVVIISPTSVGLLKLVESIVFRLDSIDPTWRTSGPFPYQLASPQSVFSYQQLLNFRGEMASPSHTHTPFLPGKDCVSASIQ